MKTLYIIRHGQTEQNKQNLVQGSGVDSDLNDRGRKQACAFYESYRHVRFDKIYVSQLKRTHQTVAQFIKDGIDWEIHYGLDEMCWGDREGRPLTEEDDREYYQMLEAWKNGEVARKFQGGESPLEMSVRQQAALDLMMSRPEEKNVLVCTHGRAIRSLMCLLSGISIAQMYLFAHSNTALYQVKHDGNHFHFMQQNDTAHLEQFGISKDQKHLQAV